MNTTVIIPIYNAYKVLTGLFDTLSETAADLPIIAINDASPDMRVGNFLKKLDSNRFASLTILDNQQNLGFVATVNRGIQACQGDVITLNQDTLVTTGWHQKILKAGNLGKVATVTPLTNNGEIASVPELCVNNPLPANLELMAKACELAGEPIYPEMPTAVGFCMLIKRACINMIGLLDSEQFGHGYGEENDYSCRARAAGFSNILCDNAYVAHIGNQSFQDFDLQPNQTALDKVLARYPNYLDDVTRFIATDPLQAKRKKIGEIYRQLLSDSDRSCLTVF